MGQEHWLRHTIPISGPATREPYLGDESPMRVSLGFTPLWFRDRLGIDFGERWHNDPEYRYETLLEMKTLLHRTFPTVPYFKPEFNEKGIEPTCATIGGIYGIMVINAMYGLRTVYYADNWPDGDPLDKISKETIEHLEPFNFYENPGAVRILEQMDTIEKRWGMVHGYLNYQGILNIAVKVRGSEIFIDMVDDPEFVHRFFKHIANTIRDFSALVQEKQRQSGFDVDLLSMSNCTMCMISPQDYETFVLPLDQELSKVRSRFGVHTCNWVGDKYLDSMQKIEKLGYFDTGTQSNLALTREKLPNTRLAVMYDPIEIEQKSISEIRKDLVRIYKELAPCDIAVCDVETTTPEDKINHFLMMVREIEEKGC